MSRKAISTAIIPLESVQAQILSIRGQKVIIDIDLARLFGVSTKRLNEQVKRNSLRFPPDFVFRLTASEKREVVANCDHLKPLKFSHVLPLAFTEHGVIMAANVLNSDEAVKASLFVVRAFVQLRQLLSTHHQLAAKIDELERKLQNHDEQILTLFEAIRQLMQDDAEEAAKPRIGFQTELASGTATVRERQSRSRKRGTALAR